MNDKESFFLLILALQSHVSFLLPKPHSPPYSTCTLSENDNQTVKHRLIWVFLSTFSKEVWGVQWVYLTQGIACKANCKMSGLEEFHAATDQEQADTGEHADASLSRIQC